MLHIARATPKSLSLHKKYWKTFLGKSQNTGPVCTKKDETERAIGLGRSTREEIVKWNQTTALRLQTGGKTSDIPHLPSGKKKKRGSPTTSSVDVTICISCQSQSGRRREQHMTGQQQFFANVWYDQSWGTLAQVCLFVLGEGLFTISNQP